MLPNVRQATIKPVIQDAVAPGALVHTDEYDIYARLPAWGYRHKTVCHARGEYARDEDGDGFCEVHFNTSTAASRRTSCRSTSASSSSCTTHAAAAKPCSAPLLRLS
jgi:ISXO2-like transposase domain